MRTRLKRIYPADVIRIVISIGIAFVMIAVININQFFYAQNDQPASDIGIGYPATAQTQRVNSIQEIWKHNYFTIEIEKQDLKATRTYKSLTDNFYTSSFLQTWLEKLKGKTLGQFYTAQLQSGETILVFLDTNLLGRNKNLLTLPIGAVERNADLEVLKKISQKYDVTDNTWYVDMSNHDFIVPDSVQKTSQGLKQYMWFAVLLGSYLLFTLFLSRIGRWTKRKKSLKVAEEESNKLNWDTISEGRAVLQRVESGKYKEASDWEEILDWEEVFEPEDVHSRKI
ncbi:hypothetical protein FACS189418_6740 [Clostridia bacterium]|nr:hypothetical protein FACS189418_6740 [Clostridia bacterium]